MASLWLIMVAVVVDDDDDDGRHTILYMVKEKKRIQPSSTSYIKHPETKPIIIEDYSSNFSRNGEKNEK